MKIAFIVEGKTEMALMPCLRSFLRTRLDTRMPNLDPKPQDGRVPKEAELKRLVENLLNVSKYDAVIALTDVYTGTNDFKDAADAKAKMRGWVGNLPQFHPHATPYDFEAWLLPFWTTIQDMAGHNKSLPSHAPETVNHNKSPAKHLEEIFRLGNKGRSYVKPRDAKSVLERNHNDLMKPALVCSELKSFLNTILDLCGGDLIE